MTVEREALDTGQVDFEGVATGETLAPVHPGKILWDDFLAPLGMSVYDLARALHVPRSRVNDIIRERRAVTADTALRLARYFGTTPAFWINLQARYDLETVDRDLRPRIEWEVAPRTTLG